MKRLFIVAATVLFLALTGCKKTPEAIPVASVTVQPSSINLTEGETGQLTASVLPEDATDKSVIWKTSNPAVATVSENGLVMAVAAGTATVTATSGGKSGSCNVTVEAAVIPVTEVTLDKSQLTLWVGETYELTATVKPDNATDKTVVWSSSNPEVAEVVANGTVIAHVEGEATITATAGGKSATCTVTVRQFGMSFANSYNEMTVGETAEFSVYVSPADAEYVVEWSVSNSSVASVTPLDDKGHRAKVKALTAGGTDIAIQAAGVIVTHHLTVKAAAPIQVTSVSVSPSSISLVKGATKTLTATVKPDNATDKTVTWSSTNASVATVSSSGVVTAVGVGSATITAKAGSKTASCSVTVTSGITSLSITSKSDSNDRMINRELHITQGEAYSLQAEVTGSSGADKSVVWSSDNSNYVSVTSSGVVTAVNPLIQGGTVKCLRVVAKSKADPSVSDYVNVYVYSKPTDIVLLNTANAEFVSGKTRRLTFSVSPSTARQYVTITNSNSSMYSSNWKLSRVTDLSYDFTAPTYTSSMDAFYFFVPYRFAATTTRVNNSVACTKSFELNVDQWLSTDVKPMDYVYYNSTTDKFRISDGGLRTLVKKGNYCRKENVSPQAQSGEKCIAVITYVGQSRSYTYGGLSDFGGATGDRCYAIALHDAPLSGNATFKWSDDKDDVDGSDNWESTDFYTHVTQSAMGNTEWRNAYGISYYTGKYNYKRGNSHDIKLMDALKQYASKYPAGTMSANQNEVKLCDGYNTHWVLPTFGMTFMSGYGSETDINFVTWENLRTALFDNIKRAGGEEFTGSWSINTLDRSNAYLVGGVDVSKTSSHRLRPWLFISIKK